MRIRADRDRCVASGLCAALVPEVFDQDDQDALVVVVDQEPARDLHDDVREAARNCPAEAIRVDPESVDRRSD